MHVAFLFVAIDVHCDSRGAAEAISHVARAKVNHLTLIVHDALDSSLITAILQRRRLLV